MCVSPPPPSSTPQQKLAKKLIAQLLMKWRTSPAHASGPPSGEERIGSSMTEEILLVLFERRWRSHQRIISKLNKVGIARLQEDREAAQQDQRITSQKCRVRSAARPAG